MSFFSPGVARPTLDFRGLLGQTEPILITGGRATPGEKKDIRSYGDRNVTCVLAAIEEHAAAVFIVNH
jgi:hypothetical protein